jgi:hypothetical protein
VSETKLSHIREVNYVDINHNTLIAYIMKISYDKLDSGPGDGGCHD